jgi:hypothetical protein
MNLTAAEMDTYFASYGERSEHIREDILKDIEQEHHTLLPSSHGSISVILHTSLSHPVHMDATIKQQQHTVSARRTRAYLGRSREFPEAGPFLSDPSPLRFLNKF